MAMRDDEAGVCIALYFEFIFYEKAPPLKIRQLQQLLALKLKS